MNDKFKQLEASFHYTCHKIPCIYFDLYHEIFRKYSLNNQPTDICFCVILSHLLKIFQI